MRLLVAIDMIVVVARKYRSMVVYHHGMYTASWIMKVAQKTLMLLWKKKIVGISAEYTIARVIQLHGL